MVRVRTTPAGNIVRIFNISTGSCLLRIFNMFSGGCLHLGLRPTCTCSRKLLGSDFIFLPFTCTCTSVKEARYSMYSRVLVGISLQVNGFPILAVLGIRDRSIEILYRFLKQLDLLLGFSPTTVPKLSTGK